MRRSGARPRTTASSGRRLARSLRTTMLVPPASSGSAPVVIRTGWFDGVAPCIEWVRRRPSERVDLAHPRGGPADPLFQRDAGRVPQLLRRLRDVDALPAGGEDLRDAALHPPRTGPGDV